MADYVPRIMDSVLEEYLGAFGAVLITGPKWCGKTTTAKRFANSVLDLQDENKIRQNIMLGGIQPSELLVGKNPRLIDEWH